MREMEKITGDSPEAKSLDITQQNIEQLKQLFPDVFSENKIDFEALKAVLGEEVDDSAERYNFTWNGKAKARQIAQTPSIGTLRPSKEESVNWDTTENLFIEGDNLEVLKLLQKSYHRKVKMIYIDPPYNTGKDFVYKDNFNDNIKNYLEVTGQVDNVGNNISTNSDASGRYHSNWLNMIYPRLKLARNLLSDDGIIFISIDDYEQVNLKRVCDEIFGEDNSLETIIWKKRYQGAKEKHLVAVHEYILVYAKDKNNILDIQVPATPEYIERYYTNKDNNFSTRGGYRTQPLEAGQSMDVRDNLRFTFLTPNGETVEPKRQWIWSKERVEQAIENGEIGFNQSNDGRIVPYIKQYLKDRNGVVRKTKKQTLIDNVFTQNGTKEITDILGKANIFPFPKPTDLIIQLFDICNLNSDDIVLDFFAGSNTTAHTVLKYNEKYKKNIKSISVQIPEPVDSKSVAYKEGYRKITDISRARINKVISNTTTSFGYKNFKLDETNIKPWDADFDNLEQVLREATESIKSDRSNEDVLYEILLKYGIELTVQVETEIVNGKQVFVIGAGALIVCLDDGITSEVVEGIAKLKDKLDPETTQVVFKDAGFADSNVKTNAIQILKQAGVDDVKSI